MWKFILIIIAFFVIISNLYADGYPTEWVMCHVIVLKNDDTEITGYMPISPVKGTLIYSDKPFKQGEDILPFIKKYYSQDDTLTVNTILLQNKDINLIVESARRRVKVSEIRKIVTLESIDTVEKGMYYVNFGAVLNDKEYALAKGKQLTSIEANNEGYGDLLLLSTNPNYTLLDLYLYACLISKCDSDLDMQCDPFFVLIEKGGFFEYLVDFVYYKKSDNYKSIVDGILRSKENWLTMAKYLEKSQAIKPEARAGAIDTLNNLAEQCDKAINQLAMIQKSHAFPKDVKEGDILHTSIIKCVFPNLRFESKEDIDWYSYLWSRGIIKKSLAWD